MQEPQVLQNGRLQRRSERTHRDRLSRGWQEQAGSGSRSFQVGLMCHNKRGLLLGKRSTLAQPVYLDGGPWPMQSVVFEHVTTDRTKCRQSVRQFRRSFSFGERRSVWKVISWALAQKWRSTTERDRGVPFAVTVLTVTTWNGCFADAIASSNCELQKSQKDTALYWVRSHAVFFTIGLFS